MSGLFYIGTKDVNFDRTIDYENGVRIPNFDSFKIAPANKILLCIEGGSAGRKIAKLNQNVCFGNKLACFNTYYNVVVVLAYACPYFLLEDVLKTSKKSRTAQI